jgi:hypothetical protein
MRLAFHDIKAPRANGAEHLVYVLGGMRVLGKQIVHLVVCDVRLSVFQHRSVLSVVHRQVECLFDASVWGEENLAKLQWQVQQKAWN